MSSVNCARPVKKRASSVRETACPIPNFMDARTVLRQTLGFSNHRVTQHPNGRNGHLNQVAVIHE